MTTALTVAAVTLTAAAMADERRVSPWAVVVGVLVAAAVLVAAGPRGRGRGVVGRRGAVWGSERVGEGHDRASGSGDEAVRRSRWLPAWWPWGGVQRGGAPSVQVTVTQVAGLLRAGIAPGQAWQSVGRVRVDPHGVPDAEDLAALVTGRGLARGTATRAAQRQAAAIVAACRVAAETGAPLASALDVIVGTLVAAARADQERTAALAGPQSTARVLTWLPVFGAVIGTALGADPVGLLMGGGLGAAPALAGLLLMAVGHQWTRRLVARARAAGEAP